MASKAITRHRSMVNPPPKTGTGAVAPVLQPLMNSLEPVLHADRELVDIGATRGARRRPVVIPGRFAVPQHRAEQINESLLVKVKGKAGVKQVALDSLRAARCVIGQRAAAFIGVH